MTRYRVEEAVTRAGYTRWVQPVRRGYKMACCDCGLVHVVDFRVQDGRAQLRMKRDNRATGQVRRRLRRMK